MIAGAAALALLQAAAAGVPAVACPRAADDPAMSASLACMALVAAPDFPSASAIVALAQPPTPFGVAVTADGRPRQRLVATFTGLPAPRTVGGATAYVAWIYSLTFDESARLGVVRNGRVDLGEVARSQFRIIVTAERDSAARERTGRIVLRGTSPSARLLAHRDLLQPLAPGTTADTGVGAARAMAAMHGGSMGGGHATGGGWAMPPMPAWMPEMPSMRGVIPRVAPFVPSGDAPPVRPSSTLRLRDGDTLTLSSTAVARAVGNRTFIGYAFNAQVPGPLLEVAQGATIIVRFHNGIDQPSAVHWHGVRLENASDGAVGVTQEPVAPGASFTYRVHFRDAGVYWYHPHVREDLQQNLGLYGNIVVRSPARDYYGPANREAVLALDDIVLGADGPAAYGSTAATHALMGRWGNVLLVNGEPRYTLDVKRGEVVRFTLTNVSNARLYNLSFGDARMKVVATDGGRFEREEWVPSVVIAPAERYVVDVRFARPGQVALVNRVQALDHMVGAFRAEVDTLGVVRVADAPASPDLAASFATLRAPADVAAELRPYRRAFDRPVDHALVLTLRTRTLAAPVAAMLTGVNAAVEWNDGMPMANWVTTSDDAAWIVRDPATGRENMDIDWRFRVGDVVKLRITNDAGASHAMQHPIHLHGQRFLILSRDGVRTANLAWKDTAVIPAGGTADLLVEMSNPGRWMLHCHIAEHLTSGMMMTFAVVP